MNKSILQDITVVIRSSNERTIQSCLGLVKRQIPENQVFEVNERPFSKAVKKTFEIGIREGKKWTLAIDADILVKDHAISEMISSFSKLDNSYYVYQGYIFDKFYQKFRRGGPHLYRTSLLKKAINLIPKEGTSLRPESATYLKMKELGYHYFYDTKWFGLHDFEQYYEDIYRKFFLHAKKHQHQAPSFLETWKNEILEDKDVVYALKGLSDGLIFEGITYVDTDFFKKKSAHLIEQLNFVEKSNKIDESVIASHFKCVEEKFKKYKLAKNKIVDSNNPTREIHFFDILKKHILTLIKR